MMVSGRRVFMFIVCDERLVAGAGLHDAASRDVFVISMM